MYFSGYCGGLVIKFCFFSLLSCIFSFREKRTEHISFLAFQTNFRKQDHCDNNKIDACAENQFLSYTNMEQSIWMSAGLHSPTADRPRWWTTEDFA